MVIKLSTTIALVYVGFFPIRHRELDLPWKMSTK